MGEEMGRPAGAPPAVQPASDEEIAVLALIERATSTVDGIWRRAVADGAGDTAIRFGEASHGLHRALLALADGHDGRRGRRHHTGVVRSPAVG